MENLNVRSRDRQGAGPPQFLFDPPETRSLTVAAPNVVTNSRAIFNAT
jgi:hypothetical protein